MKAHNRLKFKKFSKDLRLERERESEKLKLRKLRQSQQPADPALLLIVTVAAPRSTLITSLLISGPKRVKTIPRGNPKKNLTQKLSEHTLAIRLYYRRPIRVDCIREAVLSVCLLSSARLRVWFVV